MYDLISRQEAINTVLHYTIRIPGYMCEWGRKLTAAIKKDLMDDIEAIQPAQQWIPVTERLPEKCQTVIASVDTHIYEEARFVDGRWWWAYEAGTDYWDEIEKDVTAWMPLPNPYRKGANPP